MINNCDVTLTFVHYLINCRQFPEIIGVLSKRVWNVHSYSNLVEITVMPLFFHLILTLTNEKQQNVFHVWCPLTKQWWKSTVFTIDNYVYVLCMFVCLHFHLGYFCNLDLYEQHLGNLIQFLLFKYFTTENIYICIAVGDSCMQRGGLGSY